MAEDDTDKYATDCAYAFCPNGSDLWVVRTKTNKWVVRSDPHKEPNLGGEFHNEQSARHYAEKQANPVEE